MIPINKRKIGVCILLSIITLGIYQIYWEYLLVKNTRAIKKDESSCTGEMLCLIFVPFYSLFWWFTRGKIVKDEFAKYGHSAIGNEIAYLILEIFGLGIISMSIMQNDFNSLSSDSTQSIQLSAILIPIIVVALLAALVVPVVIYTVSNEPVSDGSSESEEGGISLSVTGPKIFLSIDALKSRFGDILGNPITQTTVTLFLASVILITAAFFIGRSIKKRPGRGQVVVEKLVSMLYGLVSDTMGKHNVKFAPYIGTIFLSSLVCTLLGTTQVFRSATADLSVTAAWAIVTSVMVWASSIKNFGFKAWLKGFTEPIVVMTPMNIVSEIAQPLSMAFRHFGNVAGGGVLTTLIYAALSLASSLLFGWLPDAVASIPFLQVGIPAFLSIYFDLFSGFVQAFVFSLLTMVYVGSANPPPEESEKSENAN